MRQFVLILEPALEVGVVLYAHQVLLHHGNVALQVLLLPDQAAPQAGFTERGIRRQIKFLYGLALQDIQLPVQHRHPFFEQCRHGRKLLLGHGGHLVAIGQIRTQLQLQQGQQVAALVGGVGFFHECGFAQLLVRVGFTVRVQGTGQLAIQRSQGAVGILCLRGGKVFLFELRRALLFLRVALRFGLLMRRVGSLHFFHGGAHQVVHALKRGIAVAQRFTKNIFHRLLQTLGGSLFFVGQ